MKPQDIENIADAILAEPQARGLRDSARLLSGGTSIAEVDGDGRSGTKTPDQSAPSETGSPKRPAGRTGAARWVLAGFAAGVVFWHFVGFWGFVSDVVLNESGKPAMRSALVAAPRSQTASRATAAAGPASFNPARATRVGRPANGCAAPVLDRRTGKVRFGPCPGKLPHRQQQAGAPRGAPAGSSVRQAPSQPLPADDWAVVVAPGALPVLAQGLKSFSDQE